VESNPILILNPGSESRVHTNPESIDPPSRIPHPGPESSRIANQIPE
jgi:hypothetical protein